MLPSIKKSPKVKKINIKAAPIVTADDSDTTNRMILIVVTLILLGAFGGLVAWISID